MPDTPTLLPSAVRNVRAWVRGALALEGGSTGTAPAARAGGAGEAELLEAVRRHRVVEVLAPHTDALGIPPALAGAIAELHTVGRRAQAVQVLEIARVAGVLSGAGLDHLVFKGPALAAQSTGDPAARGPGDIDVLVAPDRVEDAFQALTERGWHLRASSDFPRGSWAWRHALHAFNSLTFEGAGSTIDLHWRLDPTLHALPTFAAAWAARQPVELGNGVVVETLSGADALAHTCLHSARDSWRWLRSLVDVNRLARLPEAWDRDWSRDPLRRLEISTLAITRAELGLPAGVPTAVLARLDAVPSAVLARARTTQERPLLAENPVPGEETLSQVRYLVAASPQPRDLVHTGVVLALPVSAVVGVRATSAWVGVPVALWRRLGRIGQRITGWVAPARG